MNQFASPSPDSADASVDPASALHGILGLLAVFLRQRRWFFRAVFVLSPLLLAILYPRGRSYTAEFSFFTEAPRGAAASPSAAVATQLGINLSAATNTSPSLSPQFYPELLKAPQFLESVVETPLTIGSDSARRTLIELYGVESPDPHVRRVEAAQILGMSLKSSVAVQTGIVRLSVTADNAPLALAIARTVLTKLSDFNIKSRQGRAAAERTFIESRLPQVRAELRAAEDRLTAFLLENRDLRSPSVLFERTRLEREVTLRSQVYTVLAQSLEQARIDEVRDTPVVTVLSNPELPVLPDPLGRLRLAILCLFAGVAVGGVAVFVAAQFDGSAGVSSEEDVAHHWAALRQALRNRRFREVFFGR